MTATSSEASAAGETAWARLVPHVLLLRRRIDRLEAARCAPRDPDLGEQALAAEGDEVSEALERSLRDKLREAEDALQRISAGTYGICSSCGGPITDARLRALPTALRCTPCEAQLGHG
ncbi:MAG: TraR/DksA C4-type zinc finger protein [Sphingomonadaceae bacterium]|nr:TraR/DksA C4-type zinc finger protein [Sphingomonadaceae bacterium]